MRREITWVSVSVCVSVFVAFFSADNIFRSKKGYQCQNSLWDWWGDDQVTTGKSG